MIPLPKQDLTLETLRIISVTIISHVWTSITMKLRYPYIYITMKEYLDFEGSCYILIYTYMTICHIFFPVVLESKY